jgi:hypothetical protein
VSVQAELFYDGAWQAVDAYSDEGWRYRVGPSPNDPYAPSSTALELTLANDDLSVDPSRVDGPLYGRIGRNTPVRLVRYDPGATTVSDTFNGRTVASGWGTSSSGTVWTASGGSASDYSVSGGLGRLSLGSINTSRRVTLPGSVPGGDARLLWTIPVDPTGDDIETTLMIAYQDASNYVQASIYWDRDNRPIELQFVRRVAGVVSQLGLASLDVSPLDASLTCWMRVQWFGLHMRMKVWPAADTEPDTWSLSAVSPTTGGWTSGQVGIRANLQPAFAGATPVVVTVDQFSLAAFNGQVLSTVEASSWQPERTLEHQPGARRGRSHTDFAGEGFIRRLGLWDDLESPIRGYVDKTVPDLLGYYPFEEPDGAQYFANLVPGTGAAGYEGTVRLGQDGSGGSAGAFELGADGAVRGSFAPSSGNGYQIAIDLKLEELPSSGTYIAMWQWVDTAGRYWYWRVNDNSFQWEVAAADGSSIVTASSLFGTGASPAEWIRLRMKVTVSGGTVSADPAWYMQDFATAYGTGFTFASSTAGRPRSWAIIANAYTDGALFEHLFATSDTDVDLVGSSDAAKSFNGFLGETAFERFIRIVTQARSGYIAYGDSTQSPQMGRQPKGANPIEILAECAATDGGMIYDDPFRLRLAFRMNSSMINQVPVLALTRGVDVAPPLRPIIDDTRAANDLRVTNWDGTEARVVESTGPRSVQSPPVGAGRNAGRLEVSFKWAGQLEQRGNWELRQNTIDRPRYGQVTVDLLANPEHQTTIDNMRPGDLITLDGVEPDTVPLLVLQLDRAGSAFPDKAIFNCIPADLYLPGEFDDGLARYDSKTTTLAEDLTTSETVWDLAIADPADRWRPGSGGWDVVVGGERCTVTNVTTGAASGDGWAQTMTCTRSVNGVVKEHAAGAEVHIYQPARYVMRGTGPI